MGPFVECLEFDVTSLTVQWSDVSSDVTSWNISVFNGKKFVKVLCLQS